MGRKRDYEFGANLFASLIVLMFSLPFLLINYLIEKHNESVENSKLEEKELEVENANININEKINDIKQLLSNVESEEFDYSDYYNSKLIEPNYFEYIPLLEPKRTLKERIFYKNQDYQKNYKIKIKEYSENEKVRKKIYNDLCDEYKNLIDVYNKKIMNRKSNFLSYNKLEVEKVLNEYIQNNIKDNICNSSFSINYNLEKDLCIINYRFKNYNFIPDKELVYLNNKSLEIECKKRKDKAIRELYEEYINKVALKILDLIFKFNKEYINEAIFNGYVYEINQATGKYEKMYILTVTESKEQYLKINLNAVNHKECLKELGYKVEKNFLVPRGIDIKNNIVDLSEREPLMFDVDGIEFEKICEDLLIANDFTNVEVTPASGDYGADVIAYKDDIKYAIQCKMYSKSVGVKAIQEVMGSKSIYNCHVAVVLTNNYFTNQAKKLAKQNNVLLWDREKLAEFIKKYNKEGKYVE